MFIRGQRGGTIRFSYRSQGNTHDVCVAGTFSQWKPLAMKRERDGSFALTVAVPPGTHEYRFIVNGNWTTDTDNASYAQNPFGCANSVIQAAQQVTLNASPGGLIGSAHPYSVVPFDA